MRARKPQTRRPWCLATTLLAAFVAVTALGLSSARVPAVGVESAAAGCAGAKKQPRRISTRRAARAVLCLVNKKRRKHGARALKRKRSVNKAARRHTRRMVETGCFSHECPGEPDLVGRLKRTSYLPCNCSWGAGENLNWGKRRRGSPKRIVRGWMRSSGHRANILNRSFRHIGIGVRWGAPGAPRARAGTYTIDFGYRR